MSQRFCLGLCLLLAAFVSGAPRTGLAQDDKATILYLPTAEFQFEGGWQSEGAYLKADPHGTTETVQDALTLIDIPVTDSYQVWAWARDYATNQQGTRRFKLGVDGRLTEKEAGAHGQEGFRWELLDEMPIEAGPHAIRLHDTTAFFGRVQGVVLSSRSLEPAWFTEENLASHHAEPRPMLPDCFAGEAVKTLPGLTRETARLENDGLRVLFIEQRQDDKKPLISARLEIQTPKGWLSRPLEQNLFMQYTPEVEVTFAWFPHWSTAGNPLRLETAAGAYEVDSFGNPFLVGNPQRLTPRSARKLADNKVETIYELPSGKQAKGLWRLDPAKHDIRFSLEYEADKDGFYSVGMAAFQEWRREDVAFLEMPPLYQFQRFPARPVLVTSSLMPHPMALFEIGQDGQPLSLALVAEPDRLPFRWSNARNPIYGFTPVNWRSEPQPCIFSPVLGLVDSEWKSGETHSVAWRLLAFPGKWTDALEYVSENIMEVKDYRRPVNASLTGAALNIFDLLRNRTACGWDDELKGFYDIESQNMVKQASPLTLLSAAVLMRDEEFYANRALPSIEFVASRAVSHIYRGGKDRTGSPVGNQLHVPGYAYDAAFWQGAWSLLGRHNPWMAEFITPGTPAFQQSLPGKTSDMPSWATRLGAYRFDQNPETLQEVLKEADEFLETRVYGPQTQDLGLMPFYNVSFYPYWWDLVELYEITGEKKYLAAAEEGAFHTIAGLWSHPRVPSGEIVIHDPEELKPFAESHPIDFYRGGELIERQDPMEFLHPKRIDAWKVAQVGLGLEQPITQMFDLNYINNIRMAVWAPHLLRVYRYTGRDIYRTYARNSVIGRFSNYPGYGIGLYSDLYLAPDYPYADAVYVGGLYYHHIAPHLAFTLDYLFADALVRSGGKIHFPHVIQKNYVWFHSRLYGVQSGEVFGSKGAVPWLERGLVELDTIDADWLAARGKDRFYLMLMNQLKEPLQVNAILDAEKIGLAAGGEALAYENDQETARKLASTPDMSRQTLTLPAMGMVTLSLPATEREVYPAAPALETGHLVQDLPAPWNKVHAFRIRGPFAKDALYVVVENQPVSEGRVELRIRDGQEMLLQRAEFPYEFSVYPIDMDRTLNLEVRCAVGLEEGPTASFTLRGTKAAGD